MSDIYTSPADTLTLSEGLAGAIVTPNQYSLVLTNLKAALLTGLAGPFSGIVVRLMQFHPAKMPDFPRYAVIVSPVARPWSEKRLAVGQIQYLYAADVLLFVRNYHEESSLFGTVAPDLGIFQLVHAVKELLRGSDLGGLLDKTYDEPAAPVEFDTVAGFDSGEQVFVHRAKVAYQCRTRAFCHYRIGIG